MSEAQTIPGYRPPFWGPYLSNRQWGTVRKDCSLDGNCWDSTTFAKANKTAYHFKSYDLSIIENETDWEYDGLFGYSDSHAEVCMSLALWNTRDPILKERLFGLSGPQGNHGEDIKELLYYLDGTPDHSFMRAVYKYPQCEFPYKDLVQESMCRDGADPEYEITETGLFDQNEYFDVEVTYAKDKAVGRSLICCYTVTNQSDNTAPITIIPKFWSKSKYFQRLEKDKRILINHSEGRFILQYSEENSPFVQFYYGHSDLEAKVIKGNISNERQHYKCAIIYKLEVPSHTSCTFYWTLYPEENCKSFTKDSVTQIIGSCQSEADKFYHPKLLDFDDSGRQIARQAYAGLLWSKQYYKYNAKTWKDLLEKRKFCAEVMTYPSCVKKFLEENEVNSATLLCELAENIDKYIDKSFPSDFTCSNKVGTKLSVELSLKNLKKKAVSHLKHTDDKVEEDDDNGYWFENKRNKDWDHLDIHDVLAVPDKWEFPWFAAWDTAFQMIPFVTLDPEFSKQQLSLFLEDRVMHPSGQLPGCEFDFSDPNPPIHAWSCLSAFRSTGNTDYPFLARTFEKLQKNFNWWVRERSVKKKQIYTGGFLGMDNISVLDRTQLFKMGVTLEQADATGWVALYSLNMLEMSLWLLSGDRQYSSLPLKFLKYFLDMAVALNRNIQKGGLWHPHEKFYYDVMQTPSGRRIPINLRSLVGIVPLFACLKIDDTVLQCCQKLKQKLDELCQEGSSFVKKTQSGFFLSAVPQDRALDILRFLLDENEFLSSYGVRSLSKVYDDEPYRLFLDEEMQSVLKMKDKVLTLRYTPGESDTNMFGGNSNWRGPIWLCMNYMIVEMLETYHAGYGDNFPISFWSFKVAKFQDIANEICKRIVSLFTYDKKQKQRPCHGSYHKYQNDWKDLLQFHEYFHAETGRGCGASHQTGWTALVVNFMERLK